MVRSMASDDMVYRQDLGVRITKRQEKISWAKDMDQTSWSQAQTKDTTQHHQDSIGANIRLTSTRIDEVQAKKVVILSVKQVDSECWCQA